MQIRRSDLQFRARESFSAWALGHRCQDLTGTTLVNHMQRLSARGPPQLGEWSAVAQLSATLQAAHRASQDRAATLSLLYPPEQQPGSPHGGVALAPRTASPTQPCLGDSDAALQTLTSSIQSANSKMRRVWRQRSQARARAFVRMSGSNSAPFHPLHRHHDVLKRLPRPVWPAAACPADQYQRQTWCMSTTTRAIPACQHAGSQRMQAAARHSMPSKLLRSRLGRDGRCQRTGAGASMPQPSVAHNHCRLPLADMRCRLTRLACWHAGSRGQPLCFQHRALCGLSLLPDAIQKGAAAGAVWILFPACFRVRNDSGWNIRCVMTGRMSLHRHSRSHTVTGAHIASACLPTDVWSSMQPWPISGLTAAKTKVGTTLANVDWLHGPAESLLTITNLLIGRTQSEPYIRACSYYQCCVACAVAISVSRRVCETAHGM